jgi:hypothetical protein
MSIQQNFPAITPSLSLNFARSKKLDPRITFTRTSSATRTNETGLVEVVPANAPRFDHSYDPVSGSVRSLGLLVEEQRTNLITYSEDFNDASWAKTRSSVITDTIVAPDGFLTADKLVEDTSASLSHAVGKNITFVAGSVLTLSVFVKSAERNFVILRYNTAVQDNMYAAFDLSTGQTGSTAVSGTASVSSTSIQSFGNGWYRCVVSGVPSTTQTSVLALIHTAVSATDPSNTSIIYTGDGTSGIYIWGAQLEAGAFPTSYIPTTTSTVTRTADNVSMVGENFSSWYNQNEGTLYSKLNTNPNSAPISFDIGSVGTRMQIFINSSNILSNAYFSSGNSIVSFLKGTVGDFFKIATTYKLNDYAISRDGDDITTDTDAEVLPFTKLILGSLGNNTFKMTGHISQLTYYPRRLTNAQLVTLTR